MPVAFALSAASPTAVFFATGSHMDEAVAERGVAKARGEGRERHWAEAVFPPLARVKGVGRRPRAGEVEGRVVVDVASC